MHVKKLDKIKLEEVNSAVKTYKQVLIGGPNFAMRKFIIEPGGFMPLHTNTVEHEQMVLNGKAKVVIEDKIYEVEKNDIVFIPAGVPHSYETVGDENFEFMCMIPNKQDVVQLLNK
jgi:quercetin dioxygenase-like cupin family protein